MKKKEPKPGNNSGDADKKKKRGSGGGDGFKKSAPFKKTNSFKKPESSEDKSTRFSKDDKKSYTGKKESSKSSFSRKASKFKTSADGGPKKTYKPKDSEITGKPPFKSRNSEDNGKRTYKSQDSEDSGKKAYKPKDSESSFKRPSKTRNSEDLKKPFGSKSTKPDFASKSGSEGRTRRNSNAKDPDKTSSNTSNYKKSRSFTLNKTRRKSEDILGNSESKRDPKERINSDKKSGTLRPRVSKKATERESSEENEDLLNPEFDSANPSKEFGRKAKKSTKNLVSATDTIRLNRWISNAGVCSRRDADKMIEEGLIKVNGKVVTEMGYQVNPGDVVKYGNKSLNREKLMYVLLNKPKDFITTMDDPEERKTVMQLIANACKERVYPVGRLDRNTTGLLLLTNDGELSEKLTHPSNDVRKVYQVDLDKPLTDDDIDKITQGLTLEDGSVKVDDIAIVSPDRMSLGIELHVGKNRIVRRIFEHLGYDVVRLDRVMYAGLTKKDLPRGKWRLLTDKEVIKLKHIKS